MHRPERMCVGCRKRAAAVDLLRLVVVPEREDGSNPVVVPDLGRRLPGRGAHLHPEPRCLDLAMRRQALSRALRVTGAVEVEQVRPHLHVGAGQPAAERNQDTEGRSRRR